MRVGHGGVSSCCSIIYSRGKAGEITYLNNSKLITQELKIEFKQIPFCFIHPCTGFLGQVLDGLLLIVSTVVQRYLVMFSLHRKKHDSCYKTARFVELPTLPETVSLVRWAC